MKNTVIVVGAGIAVVFGLAFAWKPPTSSSDVAGWVQAFGSIVAIGLAVWLQYEAKTDKRREAERLAVVLSAQVLACLDGLQYSCRTQNWTEYVSLRQLLMSTSAIEPPLGELSADFLNMVLGLKNAAVKAVSDSADHGQYGNWAHFDGVFGNLAQDCRMMIKHAGLTPGEKSFSP
ncbi:hypothetical protein [Polaromonas sp. YR568]|uniref:hypothetical protein n=1 Tax=Polaromonas sp. YR568 TaxID=1855301 RepID=UPI00398BE4C2